MNSGDLLTTGIMMEYFFEPLDIIVFPIIDWHSRFQRPQQISTRLAQMGHRVFYLRTYFSSTPQPSYYSLRDDGSIFEILLGSSIEKNICLDQLDAYTKSVLFEQFSFIKNEFNILKALCIVDMPFWGPFALDLKRVWGWKVVYDCMDHLGGFSNVNAYSLQPEAELIEKSDLVVATSHILFNEKSRLNKNCMLIPNGTDFNHFHEPPEEIPDELIKMEKPIIGYYGAISDWFDIDLINNLALARPNWNYILIGDTTGADVSRLKKYKNVFLLGEKSYDLLPTYLHYFDTCIIPFKKIPLTQATNPVKLYEYLSAGKSIVATDLEELGYYKDYVRLASSTDEWIIEIEHALGDYDPAIVERRIQYARTNTWDERALLIEGATKLILEKEIDPLSPLPLLFPEETIVSSRLIAHHEDVDYWCRIYEQDDLVYKQISFDLAKREGRLLSQLNSEYFPKPLNIYSETLYSVITFRKLQGRPLRDSLNDLNSSPETFYSFIVHCLALLNELEINGIKHRNISRDTIWVQKGKPVLLDFAWANTSMEIAFTPHGLGGFEKPPEGDFSDVYSLGIVLGWINQHRFPAFNLVFSLMTDADESLRVTDLDFLITLFSVARTMAEENLK